MREKQFRAIFIKDKRTVSIDIPAYNLREAGLYANGMLKKLNLTDWKVYSIIKLEEVYA